MCLSNTIALIEAVSVQIMFDIVVGDYMSIVPTSERSKQ